jgi:peptidoglycan-N-acetylglucosamine deacetylase
MRKLTFFIVLLVLPAALAFGLWEIGKSRTFQFFGVIVPRVETPEKLVALTFDDGPTPEFTGEILRVLQEADVKATFFLIGGELEKHPEEGKKIVAAGHEIGNHSYSHQRMILVTPSFVKEEIEKTDALIRAAGYEKTPHFRPPYGKKLFALPYYLSNNNRRTITWDVEPESFPEFAKSSEATAQYVLDNTKNGSIILLHVMYDRQKKSLSAVKPIIEGLKQKGFRFVTVSELIESRK